MGFAKSMYRNGVQLMVVSHLAMHRRIGQGSQLATSRLRVRDERGDVTPRTVGIAFMTALAVAVGVIVTTKVLDKAEDLRLD